MRASESAGREKWPPYAWVLMTSVMVLAFVLRVACFHPYADDWDPCEYVWAVDGGYLPHSPYILYLWVGRILSLVAPTDIALSFFSLVSGTVAVALLTVLVRRQSRSTIAGLVAGTAYAVFPGAVWYSGIQEVYAPAVALGLAATLSAASSGRGTAGLSGVLFGCALATHSGIVLLAPAFLLALVGPPTGGGVERKLRRVLLACGGAVLVPAAAVAWVASVLPRSSAAGPGLWDYLVGIAPLESGMRAGSLESTWRTIEGALEATVGTGIAAFVLALCAGSSGVRFPRVALYWTLWAVPYLLYESAIGYNVDPGVHMVFAAPAIAAVLGHGAAAGAGWLSRARARTTARTAALAWAAVVLVALVPAASRSLLSGRGLPSRATYLSSEPVISLIEARTTTTADAVLVQPSAIDNVNLLPAYAARRPIIHEDGRFFLFEGSPGSPLNRTSFVPVTPQVLDRLLRVGSPVVSLVPDPFPVENVGFRWRQDGRHYVLERAVPRE